MCWFREPASCQNGMKEPAEGELCKGDFPVAHLSLDKRVKLHQSFGLWNRNHSGFRREGKVEDL